MFGVFFAVLTTLLAHQDGVGSGHWRNDVFDHFAGVLWLEQFFDAIQLVAYMFEFFVEFIAVIGKPVLQALEQIPREIALIAFWEFFRDRL